MKIEHFHPTLRALLTKLADRKYSIADARKERVAWCFAGCPVEAGCSIEASGLFWHCRSCGAHEAVMPTGDDAPGGEYALGDHEPCECGGEAYVILVP